MRCTGIRDYLNDIAGCVSYVVQFNFRRFEDVCVEAFLILRRNSSLLVTLFSLMVSCGIPELQRDSDIAYLRDNLMCFEV